jgi:rubrerythrin
VENHFERTIVQLEANLPDVVDDAVQAEDEDVFDGAQNWTCMTCTTINEMKQEKCMVCQTKRPALKAINRTFGAGASAVLGIFKYKK